MNRMRVCRPLYPNPTVPLLTLFAADTMAGQMAALQGKPTASDVQPRKPRREAKQLKGEEDEESDYESGTDEDEDSESETDTDTDSSDGE